MVLWQQPIYILVDTQKTLWHLNHTFLWQFLEGHSVANWMQFNQFVFSTNYGLYSSTVYFYAGGACCAVLITFSDSCKRNWQTNHRWFCHSRTDAVFILCLGWGQMLFLLVINFVFFPCLGVSHIPCAQCIVDLGAFPYKHTYMVG